MSTTHAFMCYIENNNAVHGVICSHYIEHAWYSDLASRSIKLIFDIGSTLSMRYLAFAISSDNVNWEVLHVCDSQNNAEASVTIPDTYDGTVKFGVKLYDTPPTVGSVLNVGFDYVITGGIDLSSTSKKISMSCATEGAEIRYTLDGTDPTEASTEYIEQIEVEPPVTIKARGYKDGLLDGDVATLTIEEPVLEKLPTPVLSQEFLTEDNGIVGNTVYLENGSVYPQGSTVYMRYPNDTNEWGSFNTEELTDHMQLYFIANDATASIAEVQVRCEGYIDSDIASIEYEDVRPTLQTPTLSLSRSGTTVSGTIGNTVSGATYVYKVGSAPTSESDGTTISGTSFSFSNSSAVTVYVKGFMTGYKDSSAVSKSVSAYTPKCATPSISQSGNVVTFTCSTSGATIHYSGCGVSGTCSSGGTVTITASGTMTAYATKSGYETSNTASKTCTYTEPVYEVGDSVTVNGIACTVVYVNGSTRYAVDNHGAGYYDNGIDDESGAITYEWGAWRSSQDFGDWDSEEIGDGISNSTRAMNNSDAFEAYSSSKDTIWEALRTLRQERGNNSNWFVPSGLELRDLIKANQNLIPNLKIIDGTYWSSTAIDDEENAMKVEMTNRYVSDYRNASYLLRLLVKF